MSEQLKSKKNGWAQNEQTVIAVLKKTMRKKRTKR